MSSILFEKWLWLVILSLIIILVGPLLIVFFILLLPFPFNMISTILLVLGWGITAGYKEWIITKRKEEKKKETQA